MALFHLKFQVRFVKCKNLGISSLVIKMEPLVYFQNEPSNDCFPSTCLQTNVFQPIHQRIEMVTEQQKDMEQTFERLLLQANSTLVVVFLFNHCNYIFVHF